jgi:hypothetical protein
MGSRQDEFLRIEETQQALRDSIKVSKDLTEKAEKLVQQHRRPPEPKPQNA